MNYIGIIGFGFLIGIYLLVIGLCIVNYIIKSKALYDISTKRNIDNAWLSWVPFIKNVIVGTLAEQYDSKNGLKHNWKAVLLVLTAISVIGVIAFCFIIIVAAVAMEISGGALGAAFSVVLFVAYIGYIFIALAAMSLNILHAICIYKIYESTVPEKSLKYMIISIIVPLGEAICLYKCKDESEEEITVSEE